MTRLSHSALLSEVGGSSLQWCEGKLMLFSVVSYIVRPGRLRVHVSGVSQGCESLSLLLTATLSWEILYIMTRRTSLRRTYLFADFASTFSIVTLCWYVWYIWGLFVTLNMTILSYIVRLHLTLRRMPKTFNQIHPG